MRDIYNDVMLRRWSIDIATGREECLQDAVDINTISAADRAAVEARNAAVHQAREDVEVFEAGGEIVATAEIEALARLRAGEADEDDRALIAGLWSTPIAITVGPQRADVNAESNRRIRAGFTFAGKPFDYDDTSQKRITGAATLAGFAMGAGAPAGNLRWHGGDSDFVWIAQDNSTMAMDAQICFAFGRAAAARESAHVFAAKALKDAPSGIPADFAADEHWPQRG